MFAVRREQIDVSRQAFEVVFRDVSIAAMVLDRNRCFTPTLLAAA